MLTNPPSCPNLHTTKESPGQYLGVFLESVRQNANGDHLFECLACGYQSVYRQATNSFEQPSWWTAKWQAPIHPGVDSQAPKAQEPAKRVIDPLDLQVHQSAQVPAPAPQFGVEAPQAGVASTAVEVKAAETKVSSEPYDPDALMTIKDAATILGCKPSELLKRVKAGEVPTITRDKTQYIPQRWVDEA